MMLTGFKGVKYGLQKPARPVPSKPGAKLAAFSRGGSSDDDEDNVSVQLRRQQAHKAKQAKWEQQHSDAIAQDSTVFDYDGVYDKMKADKEQPKHAEKAARKSRYISSLLEKAKEREKEQDILYERQLLRERKVEDALYGDKEKFITAAYKKKLEDDRKWLEEEELKEALEAKNDVTTRDGLGDFYRNLHRNAAFGGSRYAVVHATKDQQEAEEDIKLGKERQTLPRSASDGDDDFSPGRHEENQRTSSLPPSDEPAMTSKKESLQGASVETCVEPQAASQSAADTAGKRRNQEDAVAAARERYLARKRAKV